MNRKGHIGTILIVFGALILVIFALFVMNGFGGDVGKKRAEMRALSGKIIVLHEHIIKNIEKLVDESIQISKNAEEFEKMFNESLKKIAEKERVIGQNTNVYAKIALGEYTLRFDGKNYVLEILDISEWTGVEINEGRYNYNLEIVFDKNEVISIERF